MGLFINNYLTGEVVGGGKEASLIFLGLINPSRIPGSPLELRQLCGSHSRLDCALSNLTRATMETIKRGWPAILDCPGLKVLVWDKTRAVLGALGPRITLVRGDKG